MASGISFKQQCPSCEAMVPIRDAALIGRKIDCPKCKYRFVVEEPADDEEDAPKKSDKVAAGKPGAKGAAAKGGAARKKGPAKSGAKKGVSTGVIVGGVLAVVALVAIVVAVITMTSGDTKKDTAGTGGTGGSGAGTGGEGEGGKKDDGGKAGGSLPALANITNYLPNTTQAVISYPMPRAMGSALKTAAMDDTGPYRGNRLPQLLGLDDLSDLNRVVTALNATENWVFTVVQSRPGKAFNPKVIQDQLGMVSEGKVKGEKSGKEYELFLVKGEMDSLGALLLRANQPKEQFAAHFLDSNTVIFADPAPLRKFLQDDAKPELLSNADAAPPARGGQGRQGGGMYGGQMGGPPMSGGMMGGPPMAGGGLQPLPTPGSPAGPGGGGKVGGPPPGMYGGMTGAGPGGEGGEGGGDTPVDSGIPASYLTVPRHLKELLDRVEKYDTDASRKKNLTSILTVVGETTPFQKTLVQALTEQPLLDLDDTQKLLLPVMVRSVRTFAISINEYNQEKLELVLAVEGRKKSDVETIDKLVRLKLTQSTLASLKKMLDLTVVVKAPATGTNPGFQPPGGAGGPGGGAPPPRQVGPPGGGAGVGTGDGGEGGETKPPDEDKNDGTIEPSLEDKVLVYTTQLTLGANDTAYKQVAETAREQLHWLRAQGEMALTRPRYHELAAALRAYVAEKNAFPQGALARSNAGRALAWRPDQRLSFYAALLPYMGSEYSEWTVDANRSWTEGDNRLAARRMVPVVLVPQQPELGEGFVVYPGQQGDTFGATHFVGIAGVGLEIADGTDAALAKKRGIFGYDRVTKKADVTDGPGKTIALIMVPGEIAAPWLAGGGATVRGVPDVAEDGEPLKGFVCTTYPADPAKKTKYDGKRGTIAIMGDAKVRFIPADLPAETFRALCTIAGGEEIEGLDALCPVIASPERELKTPAEGGTTSPVAKTDQDRIQGTWKPTSVLVDGAGPPPGEADAMKDMRMVFSGKTLRLLGSGKKDESVSFTLNPTTTPRGLDIVPPGKSEKVLGIYELTDKQLKIAFSKGGGKDKPATRPTAFTSTKGSGVAVFVMERVGGGAVAQTDQQRAQGSWVPTKLQTQGVSLPADQLKAVSLTFSGNTISMTMAGQTQRASFTLDPSKTPKTIDSVNLDGPNKGKKALGIYELTDKELKLCFADDGDTNRPTSYTATPQNKWTVLVAQRGSASSSGPAAWKTFTPKSQAFTIRVPGDFSEVKQPTPDGRTVPMYTLITAKGLFTVLVVDLPAAPAQADLDKIFADMKAQFAAAGKGLKVTAESPLKLGTAIGREYTVAMGDQGNMKTRVYVSGTKLFQVTAAPVTAATEKDVKTYFDSFKIGK